MKDEKSPGLVLGLPMEGPPVSYAQETNAERMIFGQSVATQDMASALLSHGSAESYVFLVTPQDLSAWVGVSRSHPKARVELEAGILLDGIERLGLTVWHDIRGNPAAPSFKIRTGLASRKPYPITRTIHCLSPQPYIGTLVLPLLTESVLPYDSVICTSRASRDALQNLLDGVASTFNRRHGANLSYQGRLDVLPLGIDIEFFRPLPRAECRKKLGLPEDAFVLLWFGRLAAADKADLLVLLRVVERLRRKNPQRKILLVLAGSQRPELPSAPGLHQYAKDLGISEHVLIKEAFPPAERNALYSAADVFVAPTDNVQETFGLTPLEAMACGLPQVVADWDGYRDTVLHGETGFLVPTHWADCDEDISNVSLTNLDVMVEHFKLGQSVVVDLEKYEHHLQTLLDQPALRARMAEASRRRAVEIFGWRPVIRQYEALWAELAQLARDTPLPNLTHSHSRQRYFDVFRGYASNIVPGSAPIYLTAEGRRLLSGGRAIPSQYGGLEHLFFDLSLLKRILAALAALEGPAPTAPTLDSLVSSLSQEDDGAVPGARDRARRHVLWVLKHGFASLTEPA